VSATRVAVLGSECSHLVQSSAMQHARVCAASLYVRNGFILHTLEAMLVSFGTELVAL